jgi:hypothetical protein
MNNPLLCPYCALDCPHSDVITVQLGEHLRCEQCASPILRGPIALPIAHIQDESDLHILELKQPLTCARCHGLVTHLTIPCPALWRQHAQAIV